MRRAEQAGLLVAMLGAMPVIPHANTRFFNGVEGISDEFWLLGYHELLRRCDVMLLLPSWQRSSGALGEVELAKSFSLPVFENLTDLRVWLRKGSKEHKDA